MRKVLLSLVLIATLYCSGVYGATSDDVYLRKDVFEAKMDAFMAEMRLGFEQLRSEMNSRFNTLDKRIVVLENQMESTKTFVFWGLALFGIMVVFAPSLLEYVKGLRKPQEASFTLDDVKKLINEAIMSNNLSLQGK